MQRNNRYTPAAVIADVLAEKDFVELEFIMVC